MKKKLFLFSIFLSLLTYSQVTVGIKDLKVNNTAQSIGVPIKFGTSSYVHVNFTVTLSKSGSFSIGNCYLYVRVQNNAGVQYDLITPIDVPSGTFQTSAASVIDKDIPASNINYGTGNYLSVRLVQQQSPGTVWYSPNIELIKSPTFSISPTSFSVPCNSTSPVTFICNSNNNIGTFSYKWQVGNGWSYNGSPVTGIITTTTNSIVLKPTSASVLPSSVYVSPVWNGQDQSFLGCAITRQVIDKNAIISGNSIICNLGSANNYSVNLNSIGNTFNWTISDTSIAQISSTNDSSVNVIASKQGSFTLTSVISNSCNQSLMISKKIYVGKPKFHAEPSPNNTNYVTFNLVSDIPDVSLAEQGLLPSQVVWKRLDTGSTKTGFSYFQIGPGYDWSSDVEITGTNSCGQYVTNVTITPPPPPPCPGFKVGKTNQYAYRIIEDPCLGANTYKGTLTSKIENVEIIITDSNGNIILETKELNFDLNKKLPGVYYLKIMKAKKLIYSQKLLR